MYRTLLLSMIFVHGGLIYASDIPPSGVVAEQDLEESDPRNGQPRDGRASSESFIRVPSASAADFLQRETLEEALFHAQMKLDAAQQRICVLTTSLEEAVGILGTLAETNRSREKNLRKQRKIIEQRRQALLETLGHLEPSASKRKKEEQDSVPRMPSTSLGFRSIDHQNTLGSEDGNQYSSSTDD